MNSFEVDIIALPEDWRVTHLIFLDPEWQANLRNEEYSAVGTGVEPHHAIETAIAHIHKGEMKLLWQPLPDGFHYDRSRITEVLGLTRVELKRRKLG